MVATQNLSRFPKLPSSYSTPSPVYLRVVRESTACVGVLLIQVSGMFTIFARSIIECLYFSVVLVIYLIFFFNREDKRIRSVVNLKITNSEIGRKRLSGSYLKKCQWNNRKKPIILTGCCYTSCWYIFSEKNYKTYIVYKIALFPRTLH